MFRKSSSPNRTVTNPFIKRSSLQHQTINCKPVRRLNHFTKPVSNLDIYFRFVYNIIDEVQQEEEVLAPFTQPEKNRKKRKRNSSIWKEFNEEEDAFVCKNCYKRYNKSNSTSTLQRHLKKHPQLGVHRTKNTTPIRDLLLNWIVSDGQSFKVVENEHFINLLSSLSIDNIDIPSADTIKNDINLKFATKKERVMNILKISDSVVNLTFDIWSNNFTSFLAHFINNFVPHNIFIKMREMEEEHKNILQT